ncbi:Polysaccharide Lyase Family 4 protein [Tuber magnatum]|uniref:rhamnogalacturonan endolyase n=1 Tax=Tuber magnatum TaxID=42249 RepID=A0A317SWW0_9PEZI|nr:Polysaccharide Lyase Family 4 protein [Tuber magnatum]
MDMYLLLFLFVLILRPLLVFAAWGYTDDGSNYVIDVGSKLVFKVSKTNGDINSIVYGGTEYQGYSGKNSHIESGLGRSTVTITSYSSPSYLIKVTVTYGTLVHYIVARYGQNNIYLLTNKGDVSVPASRFILRLKGNILPHDSSMPDFYDDGGAAIEASDVTQSPHGYTKSKHYQGSNYGRVMDFDYVGKTTGRVGIWLIRSNHEKASGGPFFRSLVRRSSSDADDLYEILFYSMGHTDPQRWGLQGPYVLSFTDGETPKKELFARNANWSWFDTLGIKGWVAGSARGYVAGVGIANMKNGYTYTVALSNPDHQYWGVAAGGGGAYTIKSVVPGTYKLTVYKGEYEVYTTSITAKAGSATSLNTIKPDSDPSDVTAIWRIGDWDGTPGGFLNFESTPYKPTYMHPSDPRLSSWDPEDFTVGKTATSSFPGYMWKDVNNDHLVYFKLTAAQITSEKTIRIGITEAYANGRPIIAVNGWNSPLSSASTQGGTRSLTVGTYRGNNHIYSFTVPASAFLTDANGWNILKISVISGSGNTGYLSAGISIDCVDLY